MAIFRLGNGRSEHLNSDRRQSVSQKESEMMSQFASIRWYTVSGLSFDVFCFLLSFDEEVETSVGGTSGSVASEEVPFVRSAELSDEFKQTSFGPSTQDSPPDRDSFSIDVAEALLRYKTVPFR